MSEAAQSNNDTLVDKRERSSIEFPYMGLDDAIEVAKAIHDTTGSGTCQADQLAAALQLSMASSGFRVRLSTSKLFGLIEGERGMSAFRLTDLGSRIVDPTQQRAAKVSAFQNVPLYSKLVEMHRGKTLPPPAALERVMAEIGVAKKQTDRARQTFERSAQSAGFFEFGRDKLVTPAISGRGTPKEDEAKPRDQNDEGGNGSRGGSGDGRAGNIGSTGDPLIDALIQKLPKKGDQWPGAERTTWLTMIKMAFDLAYGVEGS